MSESQLPRGDRDEALPPMKRNERPLEYVRRLAEEKDMEKASGAGYTDAARDRARKDREEPTLQERIDRRFGIVE